MQRASELSGIDLRDVLITELTSGEHAEHNRRQQHQKLSGFLGLQSARLLHALLYGISVLAEDSSEQPTRGTGIGRRTSLENGRHVLGDVRVRRGGLFDRVGTRWARRMPRETADDHR